MLEANVITEVDITIEAHLPDKVVIMQTNRENIISMMKLILRNTACRNHERCQEVHHTEVTTRIIPTVMHAPKSDIQQGNALLLKMQLNVIEKTNTELLVHHLFEHCT